jgi:hypothetical protein
MALLSNGPAIDAGDPNGCTDAQGLPLTTDQRGAARPFPAGGRCDIGAYEYGAPAPISGYSIQQGWNLFAYTDASSGITTAAQLLGALLQQSGGHLAAIYGLTNNAWTPSLIDAHGQFSSAGFTLQPVTAYLLYSDQSVTFSVQAAARFVPVTTKRDLSFDAQRTLRKLLPPVPPLD